MNIKVPEKSPVGICPQKGKTQTRFQTLWHEAQALKQKNLDIEAALDALIQRFHKEIGPAELNVALKVRQQIKKLMVFASRKSLTLWERDTLDEWIASSITLLANKGLIDDDLREQMALFQAQQLGIEIDPNSEQSVQEQLFADIDAYNNQQSAFFEDFSDEFGDAFSFDDLIDTLTDAFQNENPFADDEAQSGTGFNDGDTDNTQQHSAFGDGTHSGDSPDTDQVTSLFKTLFHRVARALHPDKEVDAQKREAKQTLMASLLEARRQHDLMQVFSLYQAHVDDTISFGEQEMAELESELQRFIDIESERLHTIVTQSELHEFVFESFYSSSPKKVDSAFKQQLKDLQQAEADVTRFNSTVTSLKKLKPELESRFQRSIWDF